MTLKTFNLDEEIYSRYSKHCKANGISMSKQVEKFIAGELGRMGVHKMPENKPVQQPVKREHSFSKYC